MTTPNTAFTINNTKKITTMKKELAFKQSRKLAAFATASALAVTAGVITMTAAAAASAATGGLAVPVIMLAAAAFTGGGVISHTQEGKHQDGIKKEDSSMKTLMRATKFGDQIKSLENEFKNGDISEENFELTLKSVSENMDSIENAISQTSYESETYGLIKEAFSEASDMIHDAATTHGIEVTDFKLSESQSPLIDSGISTILGENSEAGGIEVQLDTRNTLVDVQ